MYQKPDFIKVSVKVDDVFANYDATGCPEDEGAFWQYTIPCEGTDEYDYVQGTYTGIGFAHQCYSSLNP